MPMEYIMPNIWITVAVGMAYHGPLEERLTQLDKLDEQ